MPARTSMATFGALALGCVVLAIVSWSDPRLLSLALNSLLLALGAASIALPVGAVLAVLIARSNVPGRFAAGWAVAALIVLPLYLQYAGWDAGLGARGWFTAALGRPLAEPILSSWRGAIFVHGMAAIPWVTLIVGLGLTSVEPSLEQEALQDSTPLNVLLFVTLPRCWQWIAIAALWIMVTVTAEMQITDMYQVRTYAEEVYLGFALDDQLHEASYSLHGQLALVGSMLAAAIAVVAWFSPRLHATDDRPATPFSLGKWRWPAGLLLALLLTGLLGVPLANLCTQAGMKVIPDADQVTNSWSLLGAASVSIEVVHKYAREFGWSFTMACLAATLATAVAAPVAWFARRGRVASAVLIGLTAFCLAVPGPLVGVGLISLFNDTPFDVLTWLYDHSIAAPVLAMTIRALPLILLLLWRAMNRVGDDLDDSAAVEGASRVQRLLRIGLASQWPTLAAAWLLGVASALGELAGTILTTPPGVETISIRIFGLAHAGVDDELAALCLLAELIFLALAAVVYVVLCRAMSSR